jgi:hypothetical protein
MIPAERKAWILARIAINADGCWEWQKARSDRGYAVAGAPWQRGYVTSAYRVAYEVFAGRIPEGCVLHHLCRNGLCVNPAHLEPISHRQNVLIGRMDRGEWPTSRLCRICRKELRNRDSDAHDECRKAERHEAARSRVIQAFRDYAAMYGNPPSATAWNVAMARKAGRQDLVERYESGNWPATSAVQRLFGSWSAALEAAGFRPNPRGSAARHR